NIPWLTKKFHNTLSETVKNSDYHLTEAIAYYPDKRGMNSSQFFISSKIVSDSIKEKLSEKIYMDNLLLEKMRGEYFADITVDDWPYIYLQIKNIPGLIMLLSGILFLVSLFFLWNNLKKAGNIKGWLFYFTMGGGFLLLEVHNVSKMSLLFGTVWTVNAFVISAIMILIVAANYIIIKIKNINILILFFLLFVSFAVSYFVEMNFLIGYGIIFKLALSTIIYLSPIFFAGCIFSKNFKISGNNAAFFLGINSLGSVLGGLLENSSFKIGIRNTLIIAVCFYLVALIDYLRNKSKN
ncbi:MAG TPA: hypothetical protein PLQ81_12760, partial [bacterium]|nr:hypothetical protein [bacterium]